MQVTKINRFHKQINGNDKVTLTLKVSANLESLFTWNTKQVFLFVTTEFENAKKSLNQISLWDHIIPDKEHANLQLEMKSKYPLNHDRSGKQSAWEESSAYSPLVHCPMPVP